MNQEQADGTFLKLKGKLKEHYGLAKEDAERKIKALEDACGCASDNRAA